MSNARNLANLLGTGTQVTTADIADGVFQANKNILINSDFQVWQRGTTATYTTTASKFIADRWKIRSTGTATVTSSQQSFAVGQTDVPNNPKYYYRWDITSYTAGNGLFHQRIEDVAKHSGQTLTFSFWAKCNSSQNITTQYYQHFGTGGSTGVSTSGSTFALTTSWQKFTETVAIPSASGKTISGNDDYLFVQFIMPAAVCTIDIAQCQLEIGSTATPFEHRSFGEELTACKRYYQKSRPYGYVSGDSDRGGEVSFRGYTSTAASMFQWYAIPVEMRSAPTLTTEGSAPNDLSSSLIGATGFRAGYSNDNTHYAFYWYADAEL
jgi:hypothetical protein